MGYVSVKLEGYKILFGENVNGIWDISIRENDILLILQLWPKIDGMWDIQPSPSPNNGHGASTFKVYIATAMCDEIFTLFWRIEGFGDPLDLEDEDQPILLLTGSLCVDVKTACRKTESFLIQDPNKTGSKPGPIPCSP